MRNKGYILTLLFALLLCGKNAYAIFDPGATIQSALELKDEILSQVQEVQKYKNDIEKRVKEGYAMATSCFKNPTKCDLKGISSISGNYTTIKMFPIMDKAAKYIGKEDLTKTASKDVSDVVRKTYIYQEGKKSLENVQKNREGINSVITNQIAILFAKGAMTKMRLQNENSADIYIDPSSAENNNKDSIMSLQTNLDLIDNTRLARILEMNGYMQNASVTAGLTQQSGREEE